MANNGIKTGLPKYASDTKKMLMLTNNVKKFYDNSAYGSKLSTMYTMPPSSCRRPYRVSMQSSTSEGNCEHQEGSTGKQDTEIERKSRNENYYTPLLWKQEHAGFVSVHAYKAKEQIQVDPRRVMYRNRTFGDLQHALQACPCGRAAHALRTHVEYSPSAWATFDYCWKECEERCDEPEETRTDSLATT